MDDSLQHTAANGDTPPYGRQSPAYHDGHTMLRSDMGSWAGGIGANTLFVADLAAAKAFYANAFATGPVFEDDDSAVFHLGGALVNLLRTLAVPELIEPATAAAATAGARLVFTIEVDDVDARAEWLTGVGVTLLNGPMDRPWGPRTASFQDLDGYVWEIAGKPRS